MVVRLNVQKPYDAKKIEQPAGLVTRLTESVQKTLPILVILEDGFLPVAAIQRMINRSGIFHPQLPHHARKPARSEERCKYYIAID